MKAITCVLGMIFLVQLSLSQTMVVHKKDQTTVDFPLSQIDSITFSMQAANVVWFEDFEDDIVGQFPSPHWSQNGSTDVKADNTTSAGGQNSVRVHGSPGGCWEAIPCRLLEVNTSVGFEVEFYIRIGSDHVQGCHSWTGGAGLTDVCSWTSGQGRGILGFGYDGSVGCDLGSLGTYSFDTWNKFKMRYERVSADSVRLTYWRDDNLTLSGKVGTYSYENNLQYFHLSSGDGTIWADEIEVSNLVPGTGLLKSETRIDKR